MQELQFLHTEYSRKVLVEVVRSNLSSANRAWNLHRVTVTNSEGDTVAALKGMAESMIGLKSSLKPPFCVWAAETQLSMLMRIPEDTATNYTELLEEPFGESLAKLSCVDNWVVAKDKGSILFSTEDGVPLGRISKQYSDHFELEAQLPNMNHLWFDELFDTEIIL